MKVVSLQPVGVEVLGFNLSKASEEELTDVIDLVSREVIVVVRGQIDLDIKRFSQINRLWGVHNSPRIWCTHPESDIINRVTNKTIANGKKGLFAEGPLLWHTNGQLLREPEEVVCLWCVQPGVGSVTSFLDCAKAFSELSCDKKTLFENKRVLMTNEIEKTIMKVPVYLEQDIEIKREFNRHRKRSKNGNRNASTYQASEGEEDVYNIEKSLVVQSPKSGAKGLFFPLTSIESLLGFCDKKAEEEAFRFLYDYLLGTDRFTYHHSWEAGDVLLADQLLSLHKRNASVGERELFRTAFWYS